MSSHTLMAWFVFIIRQYVAVKKKTFSQKAVWKNIFKEKTSLSKMT